MIDLQKAEAEARKRAEEERHRKRPVKRIRCHGKPDYQGHKDEIIRYSIETRYTLSIKLRKCRCGGKPQEYFKSTTEKWVRCNNCGLETKRFKHFYEAMQAWNRGEVNADE